MITMICGIIAIAIAAIIAGSVICCALTKPSERDEICRPDKAMLEELAALGQGCDCEECPCCAARADLNDECRGRLRWYGGNE